MWSKKFSIDEVYIPKRDTQQTDFIKEYPKYDGRNTIIGIIDCGIVDISLPGMQKTTTGLPKVIDCFDFSDEGIVDTSFVFETSETCTTVPGLSGRILNIPMQWKNPSKKWHLGKISIEKLCSRSTSKEHRKKGETQKTVKFDLNKIADNEKMTKTLPQKMVDCIVWFDGEKWRACINTLFSSHLESLKVLTNFSDEHEYSFIDDKKTISYCIKIEKNGNRLQIIVPKFDHGNSVAHAAVAHFPNEPEKNGLAPGAQIISINIMEDKEATFDGNIHKAIQKLIKIGSVDIINLSLGLHFSKIVPSITAFFEKIVKKRGIIVVISAGNDGPSFKSTHPFPPFFNHFFVIGSVFTNDMNHRLLNVKKVDDNLPKVYWYSSRGPSSETFARGIDFVAPGAAIIPAVKWHKNLNNFFAGTSLAAPIAAGSIACLLSGLKANSIQYSPSKIRLALCNTASIPKNGNGLEFGNGIIQIKDAFQFFKNALSNISSINFAILKHKKTKKLGICYIREKSKLRCAKFRFKLNPLSKEPIKWDLRVVSNSTIKFVGHSETIKDDNLLSIQIDPNSLIPGTSNYAEIRGFDSSMPSLGPLFHLPITVIFPQKVTKKENFSIQKIIEVKSSATTYSYFFYPPHNSNQCTFQLTMNEAIYAEVCFKCTSNHTKRIKFTPEITTKSFTIPVHWKQMYEINLFVGQTKEDIFFLKLQIDFECVQKCNTPQNLS